MNVRLFVVVGIVLSLGMTLVLGCASPDPDPATSPDTASVTSESLRTDASLPDTTLPDTTQPDAGPSSVAPEAEAVTPAPPADSVAALLAEVRDELRRTRRAHDSLRAALAASAEASTASEAPPPAETAPDTESLRDEVRETAQNFGFRLAIAVLVLVVTFFLIKGVALVLDSLSERSAERRLLYKRVVPIARVLIWALALYVVLRGIFNVDAQGLLAAAAAIGVAVGFAAQDLLKNIFGGLVIIFDTPFQVGDKIAVGGTYGEVINIGLRSTRIVTPDDNLVSVPNAQVVDGQVSNANAGALDCQVVTDLYLPGDVDEARAKQIAYQAAASSKFVYLGKPIAVIVKDEYEHGHVVHLKVKAYVLDTRYEFLLASDVTERARRAFRKEGLLVWTSGAAVAASTAHSPQGDGATSDPAPRATPDASD